MNKVILFQGDSITDAGRNKEKPESLGAGYPYLIHAQLACDLPGKYQVVNRGVSGNRVPDLYARIVRDVLNLKPDYLSVLIGVNDIWHGLDPSRNGTGSVRYRKVYDMFLSEVREELPETKIIVLEPFVLLGTATENTEEMPDRWTRISTGVWELAGIAKELAEKHGALFLPLQKGFDGLCDKAPSSNWLRDGVHPTAAGHEWIKRQWLAAFAGLSGERID